MPCKSKFEIRNHKASQFHRCMLFVTITTIVVDCAIRGLATYCLPPV